MSADTEFLILSSLVCDQKYHRKALPHLKEEYFEDFDNRNVFKVIREYSNAFDAVPTQSAVEIELEKLSLPSDEALKSARERARAAFSQYEANDLDWLLKTTEGYCRDRAIYLAIVDSISIVDGEDKVRTKHAIPAMLQEALNVQFDIRMGHDYLDDAEERHAFYTAKETKIRWPIEILNMVTRGGMEFKTLNLTIAPTGVGKTFWMTFLASWFLKQGYDVLYITLEMREEKIGQRIDAALMDLSLDEFKTIGHDDFMSKIDKIKSKTRGRLKIKEYPPKTVSCAHIQALLDEYQTKHEFKPQIVFVDYLNLLVSSKQKNSDNSFAYFKAVSEELRALGVENNNCMNSAMQTNRDGIGTADYGMDDVSESIGTTFTADFIMALISTEDLEKLNQMRAKLFKSRYGPINQPSSFMLGIDRDKMKFFDIDKVDQVALNKRMAETTKTTTEKKPRKKKADLSKFNI